MKVTYNWLKDFVEIKISPRALADKLTMAGLEVTALETKEQDSVFELEVTSNRPDCLSVIGIAREVAAITVGKFKLPTVHSPQSTVHSKRKGEKLRGLSTMDYRQLSINIESRKDCPLYTAKIIRDVKVGSSPDWLKERLELIGCRSANNIVDITNYILFTWGEPLHAFDLDKIVSLLPGYPVSQLVSIVIRRARDKEEIVTIDGVKRILDNEILVIACNDYNKTGKPGTCLPAGRNRQTGKPIAIAGVMGGQDSEVTESTKNILLEAAMFSPVVIRRSRQTLGMQSESSYRFERGIDLEIVERASWATVRLIQELAGAGGRCVAAKSSRPPKIKKKSINLDVSTVHKILGVHIRPPTIKKILDRLGFKAKIKAKNTFGVGIPSHRPDINLEIDLIEEIARIFGYENIPKSLPLMTPQVSICQTRDSVSLIRSILVNLGLNEVITYALIDRFLLRGFKIDFPKPIEILNPLSRDQEILRPTIISSLSKCVAYNLNQKQSYINIFEIAKIFSGSGYGQKSPPEELVLGIALCGIRPWLFEQGLIKDQFGFLHFKGILEALFGRLGIKDYNFSVVDNSQEVTVYVNREKIGVIIKLQQLALESLDIKNKDVFVGEFFLDRLLVYADLTKKFKHLPVYPGISRDISLVLKEGISAGDILKAIREKYEPLLREIKIVDYYKGEQIPRGSKGLTISCVYRSDERTLTEAEINPTHLEVCAVLTDRFGAQIR